jgi:hypothetical protein
VVYIADKIVMRSKFNLNVISLSLILWFSVFLQFSCSRPCPGDANQIYIEISTSNPTLASYLSSLELTIEVDGATRSKTYEIGDKLVDGKTSLSVAIPNSSTGDKSKNLTVTVRAFGEANIGGPALASGSHSLTVSDDECPTVPILLTSQEQKVDGGHDAGPADVLPKDMGFMDASSRDRDVPADLGPEDTGVVQTSVMVSTVGTGGGQIISDPPGIACPGACTARFPAGTQVTLTSTPSPGSGFAAWSGACSGANECVITLTETSTHAIAEFEQGLIAFYALDNNTNDNSGHSHHGLSMGARSASGYQHQSNTAYEFQRGDFVDVVSTPELSGFSSFSVCAWFSAAAMSPNEESYLVSKVYQDGSNLTNAYALTLKRDATELKFRVWAKWSDDVTRSVSSRAFIFVNRWTHVCGTYNGFEVELYVNGILQEDKPLQGTVVQTTSLLKLGNCDDPQSGNDCGPERSLRGSLDNVKIYNRALLPAEIMAESSR